jgi:DNA-directed RNA polymerase subunit RPC12/RpoP
MGDETTLSLPCQVCGREVALAASKESSVLRCPYCGARSVFGRPVPCPICGHKIVLAQHKQGKPLKCPRCRAVSVFGMPQRRGGAPGAGRHGDHAFQRAGEAAPSRDANDGTQQGEQTREQEEQEAGRTARPGAALGEDQKHAKALGLRGRVKTSDVKRAYRELLAKYHPDKVSHLGDEFKQIAEQKTREVLAAYEYFRRKYNIG